MLIGRCDAAEPTAPRRVDPYDKNRQEEKSEDCLHAREGAKQAQAGDDEVCAACRETGCPGDQCEGAIPEIAVRLLAARSHEMVDAERRAILTRLPERRAND